MIHLQADSKKESVIILQEAIQDFLQKTEIHLLCEC